MPSVKEDPTWALSDQQRRILEILRSCPRAQGLRAWTTPNIAEFLATSLSSVARSLRSLRRRGLASSKPGPRPAGRGSPAELWMCP